MEQSLASYEALGGTFLPLALVKVRNLRAFSKSHRPKTPTSPVVVRSSLLFSGQIGRLYTSSGRPLCNYVEMTPSHMIEDLITALNAAREEGERLRKLYRRKTKADNPLRVKMLKLAVDNIDFVMVEVRSNMGRLAYLNLSPKLEASFIKASKLAQLERHKILKMLGVRAR
ncbi:hypothetical protein UFOVP1328_54 [uncultured Caudovirales phage]|uniref:Uncharacterized protein n=1 Tax=uncultured Caudovirales phage TaxID=2100421 RepID=A0A6J5RQA3_9CAUD|nr:hypothetical protein UFOVP1084_24 [uncultured Caudovirales phage]CAB4199540.1 hypothetical protein UFOVP1328_54 [uncultured Caudovirales phage]CAB5228336.1 hypothetical protein UFOVP1532_22 [uncultured Caudovirales phage]